MAERSQPGAAVQPGLSLRGLQATGIDFIDENGEGPGVRLQTPQAAAQKRVLAGASALADPADEREAWQAQVAAARARALEARQKSLADFVRAKSEPRLPPPSPDLELARRNSEAARSDSSLRHGDIVSTTDGMFMFIGRGDRDPQADDFVPIAHPARR